MGQHTRATARGTSLARGVHDDHHSGQITVFSIHLARMDGEKSLRE
jgi:hypothetical protein